MKIKYKLPSKNMYLNHFLQSKSFYELEIPYISNNRIFFSSHISIRL
jgi:hypothetical protein